MAITACGEQNSPDIPVGNIAKEGNSPERDSIPAPIRLTDENCAKFLNEYGETHQANTVIIHSRFGDITIKLYENTPLHRANFIYLTHKNYFDDTWFYRVSKGHVIQAGNTDGRETINKRKKLGEYTVPAEINAGNFHKYGAVAAARSYSQNPGKRSDPYEFYIVLGRQYSLRGLHALEENSDMDLSKDQLGFYSSNRGAPHLDGAHTVFGQVMDGMDVVEAISRVRVDEGEWPLMNIPIDVEIAAAESL